MNTVFVVVAGVAIVAVGILFSRSMPANESMQKSQNNQVRTYAFAK